MLRQKLQKLHISLVITGLCLLIAAFGVLGSPQLACALSPAPGGPCDPLYYDSLESRAWLEAQREITQNQNLIFKPDSVLEYTCFDQFLRELADHAQDMFSETTRWGPVLSPVSMDSSLDNLVTTALIQYITANFEAPGYDLLGGRSGTGVPPIPSIDHVPAIVNGASGGAYNCDIMNRVWMAAKCIDFISTPDEDGFFTFAEYAADPSKSRFLPTRCAGPGSRWQDELNTALMNGPAPNTPWNEDNVVTYFNFLDPASCASADSFPTGMIIARGKAMPRVYYEHVCLAPGCHYVPDATSPGTLPVPGAPGGGPINFGDCVPSPIPPP